MMKHIEDFAKDLGMFAVYSAALALVFALLVVPAVNALVPSAKGYLKTLFPGLVA